MRFGFFGAAGEVGRSCIMAESEGARLLLDSGIKLGRQIEYPTIDTETLSKVDAILISHAHLDHSGFIPHLIDMGYRGPIYATKPTHELTNVLISDYMRISKPEGISEEHIKLMQKQSRIVEYGKDLVIKDMHVRFIPAGHILGSAMMEISDGKKKVIYTGDINLRKTRLLNPGRLENTSADILVTESTYGGTGDVFPMEKTTVEEMLKSIKETADTGGKIVIPSFAVGRAQEVLLLLDDYMRSGRIPKMPIYIDGMINKAMRIHRHNVIYCRKELQQRILMNEEDPFKSPNFYIVKEKGERRSIIKGDEAAIVVTTSGMITGGPIMKYLEYMAEDERNKLIIVGYQAEGTIGRALADGAKEIVLDGRKYQIRMSVAKFHLSAHADRAQLLDMINKINGLKSIFLVHGEAKKAGELNDALKGDYESRVPELRSVYEA